MIKYKNNPYQKIEDKRKEYNFEEAIQILKKNKKKNFIESVDVSIHLGIDPKQTDQNVRGYVIFPHGIGRVNKIAVFTQGENIEIAKNSGADCVGGEELVEIIKNKKNKFDVIIASPNTMNIVSTLGPILGPKGLMPNPKTGTVTDNIQEAVKNAKKGQIKYKNDKNGIINNIIGKINFSDQHLKDNLTYFINELKKNKPIKSKGNFIKKVMLSTTMGLGINININSIM